MIRLASVGPAERVDASCLLMARFLTSAAAYMLAPFLVLLMTRHLGLSAFAAALAASVVFVGGRLFSQPLGILADVYPHAPLMPACLIAGGYAALLFAIDAGALAVAAAVLGCVGLSLSGSGFMVLLRAHIAKSFAQNALPALYSASSIAFNLGMFTGSAVGGFCLQRLGIESLALASAVLHALACAMVVFAAHRRGRGAVRRAPLQINAGPPLCASALAPFAGASAILGYLTTTVSVCLAVYTSRVLGSGAYAAGFFSMQSLALIFLLPVVGAAVGGFSKQRLYGMYFSGLVTLAVGYCAFAIVPVQWPAAAITVLALFFCASQCLSIPTTDALLTQLFGTRASGRTFGTTTSAAAVGGMLSCVVNGIGFDRLPAQQLWWLWLVPGVIGSAGLLAIAVAGRRVLQDGGERRPAGGVHAVSTRSA